LIDVIAYCLLQQPAQGAVLPPDTRGMRAVTTDVRPLEKAKVQSASSEFGKMNCCVARHGIELE